jgi:hypothetical protein
MSSLVASPTSEGSAYLSAAIAMSFSLQTPQSVDALEGLSKSQILLYNGVSELKRAITAQSEALLSEATSQQYLAFLRVSRKIYEEIEIFRTKTREHYRMSYYESEEVLVIKLIAGAVHETPHALFCSIFSIKQLSMGLTAFDLSPRAATKCTGPASSKMPDSSFLPAGFRAVQKDWPTFVIECGLSESLARLRVDVQWWLTQSEGLVKIALLMSVKTTPPTIYLEKWENHATPRPVTRSHPQGSSQVPVCIQSITISQSSIIGAPLILDFEKIFLRPSILPETDFIFSEQDLQAWANHIFTVAF